MYHTIIATKKESVVRVEYIQESWGEVKTVEISTRGQTPALRYNFEAESVGMSSGDFTAELPELVSICRRIAGAICHYNDIMTILTNEGWKVTGEKIG